MAAMPATSLVAIDPLATLVTLLGLQRQRRDGTGLEALERNRVTRFLAEPVGPILDPGERGVDLGDQLALAVAGPKLDGPVGFGGCTVGDVGVVLVLVLQVLEGILRIAKDVVLPGQQLLAEVLALPLVHERL